MIVQIIVYLCIHWDMSEPPEVQPIHTLPKFNYLIHELYPTNPHLFQDIVHYGMPYLHLPSLIPTICLLSNLTSTNLIISPSLPSPSLSSFVGGLCYSPLGFSPTSTTKIRNVNFWQSNINWSLLNLWIP